MADSATAIARELERIAKRLDRAAETHYGNNRAAFRIAAARVRQVPEGCLCLEIHRSDVPCITCEARGGKA